MVFFAIKVAIPIKPLYLIVYAVFQMLCKNKYIRLFMQGTYHKHPAAPGIYMYVVEFSSYALQSYWIMHLPTQFHIYSSLFCHRFGFVFSKA